MSGFTEKQKNCLELFSANLTEWLKDSLLADKYAVICEDGIRAVSDTAGGALDYASGHLETGSYIIQKIYDENEIVEFLYPALA